jgi:hypothetical protein
MLRRHAVLAGNILITIEPLKTPGRFGLASINNARYGAGARFTKHHEDF